MKNKQPTPASAEAIEKGCTCPCNDNNNGTGLGNNIFWVDDNCKVHSSKNK